MKLDGWECPRCNRVWGPLAMQCLHCNDGVVSVDTGPVAAPEVENPIVRRTVIALSTPGSALRGRLNEAAGDLAAAGYTPAEIAARLEAGESVDV